LYSFCTPAKSICSPIVPATATAMPLTRRADVALSTWSRRTASCQGTAPPRMRRTTRSISHGRRVTAPMSSSVAPAATWYRLSSLASRTSPNSGYSSARPSSGRIRRHHRRRRVPAARRTTPSGSTTTPRSVIMLTTTASAGTASVMTRAAARLGRMSAAKTLRFQSVTSGTSWRPRAKSAPPTATPSSAAATASPAAIRRVIRRSAPTRRKAAIRRSRRSPPKRTAAPRKTAMGSSSTTNMITMSTMRTGPKPSLAVLNPNRSTRLAWSAVSVSLPR
jgi:hypothetical protein